MKAILILLTFIFLLTSFGRAQKNYEIVSTGTKNSRIFIVVNDHSLQSEKKIINIVSDILRSIKSDNIVDYNNRNLSISVFTDKNLASYKPVDSELFIKWKRSYLAEFTNIDTSLVIYPMIFDKKRKLKIKL